MRFNLPNVRLNLFGGFVVFFLHGMHVFPSKESANFRLDLRSSTVFGTGVNQTVAANRVSSKTKQFFNGVPIFSMALASGPNCYVQCINVKVDQVFHS